MVYKRKTNIFERILLPIGFLVGIIGFYMISTAVGIDMWLKIMSIFTWLILIFLIIIAAANEDIKEEISTVIKEGYDEIRTIKELNHDLLAEMKLLRQDMKRKR